MRTGAVVLLLASACRFHFDSLGDDQASLSDANAAGDGSGGSTDAAPLGAYNIAFVTSTSHRIADLGGISGADTVCNDLASSAGLPGTYVAWLSDGTTGAATRLSGARGWVRQDGKPFVDTVSELVAGRLLQPILLTETGTAYTGQFGITTGTVPAGARGADCAGWSSVSSADTMTSGIASATFGTWTDNIASTCDQTQPFYCFGINRDLALTYTHANGRRAFVTASLWNPSGGRAGADAACQSAADAVPLGGTWRAFIATSADSAASQFSTGEPWVRLDGIRLAPTADALLSGQILDAPLNLTETMDYRGSNPAHTGATSATAVGAATSTCQDWTSAVAGESERIGLLNSVTLYFSTPIFQTCNSGGQLYCLEL